jgi:hypothetical protein
MKVYARYYRAAATRPVSKAIHTQVNRHGRAPRLDLVLGENKRQPYVHDGVVTVLDGAQTVHFHLFVKNHKLLRENEIVQGWNVGATWRGDILVMRKGVRHEVVNLRGKSDRRLADFAVKK